MKAGTVGSHGSCWVTFRMEAKAARAQVSTTRRRFYFHGETPTVKTGFFRYVLAGMFFFANSTYPP